MFSPQSTDGASDCKYALGMQSKGIPNANISASSTLSTNHVPAFARLEERRGAWCSEPNDNSPYVEILLDEEKLITKVVTQGSYKNLIWATKYQIKYLKEGKWSSYQKADGSLTLEGNTNVRALKEHNLQPPIRTHSIRIYPMAPLSVMPNEYNVVCLRLELFGCSVISCGDPGTPVNGKQARVKIGYIYGGSVEFTCKDNNYTISGADKIYCEETKNWSSPLPRCLAPCPDPGVPSNGRRIGDDFRHGKSVTFKCQDEFELKGMTAINCNDGTWTDDIPQCKGKIAELLRRAEPHNHTRIFKVILTSGMVRRRVRSTSVRVTTSGNKAATRQEWVNVNVSFFYIFDTGHPCCGQLTAFKTGKAEPSVKYLTIIHRSGGG
ncbi:hypothetical protein ACROYT_G029286 [Oculina patagonica]